MKLRRLVCGDIHFQWKYGFYFIYFVLTVIYVFGITALPDNWKHNAAAIMIYSDPAAMGLFFMGAIVLLEKSQKVLHAIAISPAKVSEYILAKVFSLMFISCVVALILGIAAGNRNLSGIIIGTALTSSIFTMLGIMAATKIANLNQFLIVIMPIEILCFVPPHCRIIYRPAGNFTVLSIYGLHEFNNRVQPEPVFGFGSGSCSKFCIISGST